VVSLPLGAHTIVLIYALRLSSIFYIDVLGDNISPYELHSVIGVVCRRHCNYVIDMKMFTGEAGTHY